MNGNVDISGRQDSVSSAVLDGSSMADEKAGFLMVVPCKKGGQVGSVR
jgi:hypothetical protein